MPYDLDPAALEEFGEKVHDLPQDGRARVDGVLGVLSVAPWNSSPMSESNPAGQYRFVPFSVSSGYGFVTFVVMEAERRVSLVNLLWFPYP